MTTLLATNRISSLQRDFRVAVTTQVIDRRTIAGERVVSTRGWHTSRNLISFARHVDCFCDFRLWCGNMKWSCAGKAEKLAELETLIFSTVDEKATRAN